MKINTKTIIPIVLAGVLLLSFYMLIDTRTSIKADYNNYLKQARAFAEKGIIIDAITNYTNALNIEDSLELSLEIGDFYIKMEDETSAVNWGQMLIEKYPKEITAYDFLLDIYYKNNDYSSCFNLLNQIEKRKLKSEKSTQILEKIKYEYFLGPSFDDVGVFSNDLVPVCIENKWGFASYKGTTKVSKNYVEVGSFSNDLAPVKNEKGEVYYIDNDGNKKIVFNNVKNVTELGTFASSLYPVFDGKTWSYYSTDYEKVFGGYEDATAMGNGVAAIKEKGFYYIIDSTGKKTSSNKYSKVVEDDKGIVYRNDVLFVSEQGTYYMVDSTGKKVSNQSYLSAKMFNDTTYAAVKGDKGWYFIDNKGNNVFKNLYFDDARSFQNGFAAVKNDGNWGYINLDGKLVIDYTFDEAKDFSSRGTTLVKSDNVWSVLLLYSQNYEG